MRYLIALAPLCLVACAGPTAEQLASRCEAYGFRPGTDAHAHCLMQQDMEERRRDSQLVRDLNRIR